MRVLNWLWNIVSCTHENRSFPRTDPILGTYVCCFDCGKRVRYSMPIAVTKHPYLHEIPAGR